MNKLLKKNKMDSSGSCFICLSTLKGLSFDDDGEISEGTRFCLRRIFHYLKIVPESPTTADFSLPLCSQCFRNAENLSRLCEELEEIQMKIHHSVQKLSQQIKVKSESGPGQLPVIEDELRKSVRKQCFALLKTDRPHVNLEQVVFPEKISNGSVHSLQTIESDSEVDSSEEEETLQVPIIVNLAGGVKSEEKIVEDDDIIEIDYVVKQEVQNVTAEDDDDVQVVYPSATNVEGDDDEDGRTFFLEEIFSTTEQDPLAITSDNQATTMMIPSNVEPKPLSRRSYNNTNQAPCKICGKLISKKSMFLHVRVHTGEKPHECEFCKRRFTQEATLVRHRRLHTGERPYSCNLCGKGFSQTGGLKFHLKSTHGVEIFTEKC